MNYVMKNEFTELSNKEMSNITGGWDVSVNIGIVSVTFSDKEVKDFYNWCSKNMRLLVKDLVYNF